VDDSVDRTVLETVSNRAAERRADEYWRVEERIFFFEKKKQKTFILCSQAGVSIGGRRSGANGAKVFWFFFSKKNNLPRTSTSNTLPVCTRFWLLRHAVVTADARTYLYGRMDVPICAATVASQGGAYRALAERLPRDAAWVVTPLRRTQETARAIAAAGYALPRICIEPGLIEQDLGDWQGLAHDALPPLLREPAHAFWPLGATEIPPGGESMAQVVHRVGATLERLAADHAGRDVVAVSHGGAIRAAVAHASTVSAHAMLHFAVHNLSLTVLERFAHGWRVLCVNETGPTLEA
jgi:broad specificity phosphatase PhoE